MPHGLIAAPSDQSSGAEWGCRLILISGAGGTAIGTGNQNTIVIMNDCSTAGIAARICGDLVLNGYNDWYLPSKDELNKLYLNKTAVGGFASSASIRYWSSTEGGSCGSCPVGIFGAWNQSFSNGTQFDDPRNITLSVRAVRAF